MGSKSSSSSSALLPDVNYGRGRPVYIVEVEDETPGSIGAKLNIDSSELVKQNRVSGGGQLKNLFKSSKLFADTLLVLPWSISFGLGASYITARDDETPSTVCILLGMETQVRELIKLNKSSNSTVDCKHLTSKSKLLKGTTLLLPTRLQKKLRVVSRKPLAKFAESWKKE